MEQRRHWRLGFATIALAIVIVFALGASIVYADDDRSDGAPSTELATTADVPNVAVYRVYDPISGEHLYTVSEYEVEVLTTNQGWNDEGVGWYAPREGGTPVYRLFCTTTGHHLYTNDENERATLLARSDWVADFNNEPLFNSGGDVPVMRMFHPSGMHLITCDGNEYATITQYGWNAEGIKLAAESAPMRSQSYPLGENDITNTYSEYAIQADVSLNGTGSGYHAKLVAENNDGASVSFGLQNDVSAPKPYDGCTALLIENVMGADPAQQKFVYAGYGDTNKTYRLLMTVQKNGVVDCYINGVRVKSVRNDKFADAELRFSVEGAGKVVGDHCDAQFSALKFKKGGVYEGEGAGEGESVATWTARPQKSSSGLTSDATRFPETVSIVGDVKAIDGSASRIYTGATSVRFDS